MTSTPNSHTYQIFVNGLKVAIRLGCFVQEREIPQTVELDLVMDIVSSSQAIELKQTVCYLTASEVARSHAVKQEWVLIEDYLESLSLALFERFPVCHQIESALSKFVVSGSDRVGVKILRTRD